MTFPAGRSWNAAELDLLSAVALFRLQRGDASTAAQMIREGLPLRDDLRDALAARLEGKSGKRIGRPKKSREDREDDACRCLAARSELAQLKTREGLPHLEAIAQLASTWGMSEKQLDHVLYPPREILAIVEQMQALDSPAP